MQAKDQPQPPLDAQDAPRPMTDPAPSPEQRRYVKRGTDPVDEGFRVLYG